MNKYVKALNYLRKLEIKERLVFTNGVIPQLNCDVLQELVNKTISKKLSKIENKHNFHEHNVIVGFCPCCENKITIDEWTCLHIYCPYCGQKLVWSNEDEY